MFNLLDRIREKPEPQRRAYALFITLLLTAMVVGVWLSIISVKGLGEARQVNEGQHKPKEQKVENSPFASLKESVNRIYTDVQEQVKKLNNFSNDKDTNK